MSTTKRASVGIALPGMMPEERHRREAFLTSLGFTVDGGGTFLDGSGSEIYVHPDHVFCLCCGTEIPVEQFTYGMRCGYCDTGACERGPLEFEAGHGKVVTAQCGQDFLRAWCNAIH